MTCINLPLLRRKYVSLAGVAAMAAAPVALSTCTAHAQSAAAKGLAIAKEADKRDLGWGDSTVLGKMILRNAQGQSSQRYFKITSFEKQSDGDKSIIVFSRPPDIEGTALLTWTHKSGDDDQWLFLPALKRVKRISSSNKSGSFVGSEFAYEDLSSQEVEKYRYKYLRDEKCGPGGKLMCFVSQRVPTDPNSGYTRQITWLDKEHYRVHKVAYYDRKGARLKTLWLTRYKQYQGKFWRAHFLRMYNHQTKKSTDMIWGGYKFKSGLSEGDFTKTSLKRARSN
jgi:hypothetical protein